ncbi:platelet-activating factor acetylhydrolase-like isoform X1 [Macrobrachium rosenbergii]|uniref:platelet-activating factor acetylhydrolase-like isoform X1 n=2 Tax=Macrobrachium rosenbergii TaxID=79674 RepID=UPI0034D664FC
MSEDLYTKGYPHIPFPRGPHSVSAADLCTNGGDSALLRLFYPTPITAGQKGPRLMDPKKWTSWYLGDRYCEGFVQFLTSSAYSQFILPALKPFLFFFGYYITKDIRIPVEWCKELLRRKGLLSPPAGGEKGHDGGPGGWPVVVVSHGMANHRSSLSTLSSDLASHGFVVVAVEHREGSRSTSFFMDPKTKEKEWVSYTAYRHDGQLDARINEVTTAFAVLRRLNEGDVTNLLEKESPFPIETFKGALDLSNSVLLGHSYGGVSALKVLADPRNPFRCGVVLDPWMYPVKGTAAELGEAIKVPILSISTEDFNQGPNRKALQAFQENHHNAKSSFLTMMGTCHHHGNDAPWISGKFMWWVTGGKSSHHPKTVHRFQRSLILTFIDKHIDTKRDNFYSSHTWLTRCRNAIEEDRHIIVAQGDVNVNGG